MKRQLWTFTVLGLLTQMLSFPGDVDAQNEASDYGIQEVAEINRLIRQGWSDYEIRPSAAAPVVSLLFVRGRALLLRFPYFLQSHSSSPPAAS